MDVTTHVGPSYEVMSAINGSSNIWVDFKPKEGSGAPSVTLTMNGCTGVGESGIFHLYGRDRNNNMYRLNGWRRQGPNRPCEYGIIAVARW